MDRIWTIGDLLTWVAGHLKEKNIEEPRLEAEVLLAFCLNMPRISLYTNYDRPVEVDERELLKSMLRRRTRGEPLAYITGKKEFMSLNFSVGPAVLIPRPETEVLVERAIEVIKERGFTRIVDVGTGSGAIAISIAHYLPEITVEAVDISSRALEVAAENASCLGVADRVSFRVNDLLQGFDAGLEMVVANLPYIPLQACSELSPSVRDYEPHGALFAGEDGFDLYRILIEQCGELLVRGGCLLMEIVRVGVKQFQHHHHLHQYK